MEIEYFEEALPYRFKIDVKTNHQSYLVLKWAFENVQRHEFEYWTEATDGYTKRIWFAFADRNQALICKLSYVSANF